VGFVTVVVKHWAPPPDSLTKLRIQQGFQTEGAIVIAAGVVHLGS
jgi:hypothetical protein